MPTSSNGSGRHCSEPRCSVEDPDPSLRSSPSNNYRERCVDPPEEVLHWSQGRKDSTLRQKAQFKDADGRTAETVGFITVADEPGGGACTCGRCGSVVCRVLTCGLYRVCQRTLLASCLTGPPNQPEDKEPNKETEGEEVEEFHDEQASLVDVHINGVRVDPSDLGFAPEAAPSSNVRPRPDKTCRRSYDSWGVGEEEEEDEVTTVYGDEGVDALITKKLLALYTEYQIEELARCTTDSLFLRKSNEIHQLINSLAEEHHMHELEAEQQLVHGIIRISTRRAKKGLAHHVAREQTLSDSGNETMRNSASFSCNNNDYKSDPNFQISDVTHSDMYARNMRKNNSEGCSMPYTNTASSSGVSVTRTSMRT